MTKRIRIAIGSAAAVLLAVGTGLAIGLPAQASTPVKAVVSHSAEPTTGDGDGETADDTTGANDTETADDATEANDTETADDATGKDAGDGDGEDPNN